MSQQNPKNNSELYQRIDEILHYIWDPIGIREAPGARDEYYSYIPDVFRLLKEENAEKQIAQYLNKIQSKNMGLKSDFNKCLQVAKIIISWSEYLVEVRNYQA